MDNPNGWRIADVENGGRSDADDGGGPGRERQNAHSDLRVVGGRVSQPGELGTHDLASADQLAQSALTDDGIDDDLVFGEGDPLAGEDRLDDLVCPVCGDFRACPGNCPDIVLGLEKDRYLLCLVSEDVGCGGLDGEAVTGGLWQDVCVLVPPAVPVSSSGERRESVPFFFRDTVFGQQVAKFPGADSALPGLDPAYF